ncbi:hypothetical protein BC829DRAFT_159280 [Chytridium lagenaria]|nr:hypothetical protein BC829DRAFT_159280 [Chytridium lagenaria]
MPILEKTGNARVVSVSSGGMFNKKLDASDLQFEKGKFDGVLAYAQTKRQQVELTEKWAKDFPTVRFYSMHPGWADTVGVQTSIPTFHEYMKDRLRTPDQGADTIVWASIAEEANKIRNGAFLFDRKEVGQHLFLAGTTAPAGEIDNLWLHVIASSRNALLFDALHDFMVK